MATEQWIETREAKQCGNSAHILLPKRFRGDRFRVERLNQVPDDLQELETLLEKGEREAHRCWRRRGYNILWAKAERLGWNVLDFEAVKDEVQSEGDNQSN